MNAYLAHHTEYLNPHHIKKCDQLRQAPIDGVALVINWQTTNYMPCFTDLRNQLTTLFGDAFAPSSFLHSEVTRITQPSSGPSQAWQWFSELDLSAFRLWFDHQRVCLSVDHTTINANGDLKLVFRDNHLLPELRRQLAQLDVDLPISEVEEQLINLEIGYFHDVSAILPAQLEMAEKLLHGWIFSHIHNRFYLNRLELMDFQNEAWSKFQLLDSFCSHS